MAISRKHQVYDKKWRQEHPEVRNRQRQRHYAKFQNRANDRKRWTEEELAMIIAPNRPCDRDLVKILERSMGAIQRMRAKVRRGYTIS